MSQKHQIEYDIFSNQSKKKPYQQSKDSLNRSNEYSQRYQSQVSSLKRSQQNVGVANYTQEQSRYYSENRPDWDDNVGPRRNPYEDRIEARLIRSDYGKGQVKNPQDQPVDHTKQMLALQNKNSLQQLGEIVKDGKVVKTNGISKKSELELKVLQKAIEADEKIRNQYLDQINKRRQLQTGITEQKNNNEAENAETPGQNEQEKKKDSSQRQIEDAQNKQRIEGLGSRKLRKESDQQIDDAGWYGVGDMSPSRRAADVGQYSSEWDSGTPMSKQRKQQVQMYNEQKKYEQFMEISRQQALQQYEISQSIRSYKQERLVEKAHAARVEKALGTLQSRVGVLELNDMVLFGKRESGLNVGTVKLIQVHHEKILEMIVDELCVEMVEILQKAEEMEDDAEERITREWMVSDYMTEFKDVVSEQAEIEGRIKEVKATRRGSDDGGGESGGWVMKEQGDREVEMMIERIRGEMENPLFMPSSIELSLGVVVNILEKKKEFVRFIDKKKLYQKKNIQSIQLFMETLIDSILKSIATDLEQANDKFAEMMYKHEFK